MRDEAHIQTAENFAAGKIATHNHISRESLEQSYDRYQNTSHKEFRKQYEVLSLGEYDYLYEELNEIYYRYFENRLDDEFVDEE